LGGSGASSTNARAHPTTRSRRLCDRIDRYEAHVRCHRELTRNAHLVANKAGNEINVQVLKLGTLEDLQKGSADHPAPKAPTGFAPTKLVAHFQVVWDKKVDKCLRKFEPAARFEVAYTQDDVLNEWKECWPKSGKKEDCAKLAFDDHHGDWILFTPAKHDYQVIGDDKGGNLVVSQFKDYGDPHIAK